VDRRKERGHGMVIMMVMIVLIVRVKWEGRDTGEVRQEGIGEKIVAGIDGAKGREDRFIKPGMFDIN
jgi:hypothetical protein